MSEFEKQEPKKRIRSLNMRNLYEKKFTVFNFTGIWAEKVDPAPEDSGIWLIYGPEKNGKTTFALKLAYYLSSLKKTLYISGEEGVCVNTQKTCKLIGIPEDSKSFYINDYIPVEEIIIKLQSKRSAEVIFIDNATIYDDEMKGDFSLFNLSKMFPDKLFIIIAHEEKGAPYLRLGKLAAKLAKITFRIQGLAAIVGGRVGANVGQKIPIIEEKAKLNHGQELK